MVEVIDQITQDLGWRERELGSLKILLQRTDISAAQKEVLLRASWALLYAHYEGFVKFCLTLYFDVVAERIPERRGLPSRLQQTSLTSDFKRFRSASDEEIMAFAKKFLDEHMRQKPAFSEVDTKSNLWPDVLNGLLSKADLDIGEFSALESKLKTLVARRNGIAHGEQSIIPEVGYYLGFEQTVYELMYRLAFEVDRKIDQICSLSTES